MLAFDGINQAPIATKRSDHHLDASYKLLLPCSTTIPTAPTDVSQFLDSAKTSLVDTAWSTLERKNLLLPVVGNTGLMISATVLPIASSAIWSFLYSEQRTKHFLLAEVQPRRFWPHQDSANMVRQPGRKKLYTVPSNKSHGVHWDSIHLAHPAPFTCHIPSYSLPAWGPSFSTKQPNLRQVGRGLMWRSEKKRDKAWQGTRDVDRLFIL